MLSCVSGCLAGDVYSSSGARCGPRTSHRNSVFSILCPQALTKVSQEIRLLYVSLIADNTNIFFHAVFA